MTQLQISQAYSSLMRLSELKLPVKKAYELYKMCNRVKTQVEFCIKEEKKIIDSFNGTIEDTGNIVFNGDDKVERAQNCFKELDQLHNTESEYMPMLINLSEDDLRDQMISPADIAALEGFVSFDQGGAV